MATTRSSARHIVLFPFPGQGHLAGFLAIARLFRLELPEATITIVSTPSNVAALRSFSAAAESSLSFHKLPFAPSDHDLPAGCESASSLPPQAVIKLFEAFESLEPALDEYITELVAESNAADDVCIIADVFVAWTVDVARRHGCAHAIFLSCSAFGSAIYHALWKNVPVLPLVSSDGMLRLPDHPEVVLHRSQLLPGFLNLGIGDRRTAFYRRLMTHGYHTDAVLVNTVAEFEPAGLATVRRSLLGKVPVWPIGPLVRKYDDSRRTSSSKADDDNVFRWLDSQLPRSVLYISFGSQHTIASEKMMELAAALESTDWPFVWVIQPPVGFDIAGEFCDKWLPEGFEARARGSNRGILFRGWAPQLGILAHNATGAFLSHCGWNSVLESLANAVPLIGWPLGAEQFYNVKMLADEWGVCVELWRGNMEKSGSVERSEVTKVIETVMGDRTESVAMRQRVAEVQNIMKSAWAEDGGSSRTALHEFLRAVRFR